MNQQKLSALQNSAVALNKKGLISLNQIDGGDNLGADIAQIKEQLANLNPEQFRKITEYILEQDLDPSLRQKMKVLIDNYDTVLKTISGIEYNGRVYDIDDILINVLENIDDWNNTGPDLYTEVTRI